MKKTTAGQQFCPIHRFDGNDSDSKRVPIGGQDIYNACGQKKYLDIP
jgi:hypothetical protein